MPRGMGQLQSMARGGPRLVPPRFGGSGSLGTLLATRTWDTNTFDGILEYLGTDDGGQAFVNPHNKVTGVGGYVATQSTNIDGTRTADKASDHSIDQNTGCVHTLQGSTEWWTADFTVDRAMLVTRYGVQGRNTSGNISSWFLQGRNDVADPWTTIDTRDYAIAVSEFVSFEPDDMSFAWRYLRIQQRNFQYLVFGEIEFWGSLYDVS